MKARGAASAPVACAVAAARLAGRILLADGARSGDHAGVRRTGRFRSADGGGGAGVLADRPVVLSSVLARLARAPVLTRSNPPPGSGEDGGSGRAPVGRARDPLAPQARERGPAPARPQSAG